MGKKRRLQHIITAAVVVVIAIALILSITNIQRMQRLSQSFTLENGLWRPSQQEREILRVREIVWRIRLGDAQAAEEYELRRDIMLSRFNIPQDAVGINGISEREMVMEEALKGTLADYNATEGGQVPDSAKAAELIPLLDAMAEQARELTNIRRNDAGETNRTMRSVTINLQFIVVGTIIGMILISAGLVMATRKAFRGDMAVLYEEARARAAELEASEQRLAEANSAVKLQNTELSAALGLLEHSLAEQRALETTVQNLSLPILPIMRGVIVMPLVGDVSVERMELASRRLLEAVQRQKSKTAIIDITGVSAIDEGVANGLLKLTQAITLIGCAPVLVGITPSSAEVLIHSGVLLGELTSYSTLQQAIEGAAARRAIAS